MRYLRALILVASAMVGAAPLPGDAARLLPVLAAERAAYWPAQTPREWLPAVVEQESGWKVRATLKTGRELGCGLGQFTKAYNADGLIRFDALEETRRLDPSLAGWSWRDCYAEQYQLRAVVLKLRINARDCAPLMVDQRNINACAGAAYNGGGGAIIKKVRMCRGRPGCDARRWFNNLELICAASSKPADGYRESFCEINGRYPGRVEARMPKYLGRM